jgi:hypothetical protein
MICSNCGKPNENENNFCKNCGHSLSTASTDPSRTSFTNTPAARSYTNIDLGYLLIACLALINICFWLAWNFISKSVENNDTQILYKLVRTISVVFSIAQFVVMFIFAKKQVYKIVIAIIAAFVIIYDLYYLVQTLTMRY